MGILINRKEFLKIKKINNFIHDSSVSVFMFTVIIYTLIVKNARITLHFG